MLTNTKSMLLKARKDGYAIPHFNATNLETLQAIISAADEMNSPVIVATSKSAIEYMGLKNIFNVTSELAKKAKVPVALHLDHGPNPELAKKCLRSGYTSIMIDSSHEDYKKNIAITKKVVGFAKGIPIEAELGRLQGVEDNVSVSEKDAIFTNPLQALDFMKKSGAFSLAVAIGTSHGAYKFKGESKLDIKRLAEIASVVKNPLVLHGASGVPQDIVQLAEKYGAKLDGAKGVSDSDIKLAVKNGISKINVDTDLRIAFMAAVRKNFSLNPKSIDMRDYLGAGRDAVKEIARYKIKLFGSVGKA
jgi:fructose-bisphosphate aldolase, class II